MATAQQLSPRTVVKLNIDAGGGVQARRILDRLIESERVGSKMAEGVAG
ncbi:hypothetical protein [Thiomonas delicata]|nr:hypothetical protein [Thiomonas delicata]